MAEKRKTKAAKPAAGRTGKAKSAPAKKATPASKKKSAGAAAPTAKRAAKTKRIASEAKKVPAKGAKRAAKAGRAKADRLDEPVLDPIGDVSSGEARTYLGDGEDELRAEQDAGAEGQGGREMEAYRKQAAMEASDAIGDLALLGAGPGMEAAEEEQEELARERAEARAETEERKDGAKRAQAAAKEPGKLERLQKILSQAGIASRRHAEEMIVAGRVMVNGQVVTQLGSKADAGRDHIRVDGKLLHGAERHRYFVLNKPRGYVTTVSDPEGRPTVMQFFAKMGERLYPVGRLDYQSEGLLLMTNDGELANLLAKAGSGVEKTYLVKVAGQPSAEELERLREGVKIEKGDQGSERVRTAPARIREVREGENPWFEVVLIEGRNRELRKMFAAIGHFAEKIRRVGYGPLVLDVEPGKFRELRADEVHALRLAAEGKLQPRRIKADRLLPKEAGVPAEKRAERKSGRGGRSFGPGGAKHFGRRGDRGGRAPSRPEFRGGPRPERGESRSGEKPRFEERPRGEFKPRGGRPQWKRGGGAGPGGERQEWNRGAAGPGGERREFRGGPRREFGGGERGQRSFGGAESRPFKPRGGPRGEQAQWKRGGEGGPRGEFKPRREFKPRFEGQQSGEFSGKPKFGGGAKPAFGRKPGFGGKAKPSFGRKPGFGGKPGSGGRPGGPGKFRGEGGGGRRFGGGKPGAQRGGWKRG